MRGLTEKQRLTLDVSIWDLETQVKSLRVAWSKLDSEAIKAHSRTLRAVLDELDSTLGHSVPSGNQNAS